ncbi:1-aminocyclopropane-1-carboxylate deaminase/D-cysteine desulfhydrase-like pyridoxal-dependent ACC family enzyme [Dyadobacter sp. BE34]|uniref:1-aminocyclopropane-1-carboxylate deaminase/D-cysteine desulfhydrase-like pyridoxal-dependent ACC family enzyme n=1 Tax=Dyadobacter fermentans TaxID=94254 RepID=A0ABU1R1Z6_9BACT|nr:MULTISPECIES: pyridoxal-phosphate dependent enzyme [Dyadobacter]MDR6807257.1 1-aminocyclopropane-1-carboxylate deaminase/D-cysteine desulfhydrase-like pyridoxal-dependent ACC family enzyme [Dyadobacter fermentans]MDR7044998.1 1-aminocyclopropane-1-carboxylate deaminase/D-cysteine desulfhydrase-like pyridoxal-dependent ACC family enzyme [Dyadobacter sp. BE242]MDR7199265.1 1-aminocyclopropane-1-carboxylate deaminase/D-cysteine desulfhydrase-like pyridoxal-dependent ACC family enzyme [Dyadobacte
MDLLSLPAPTPLQRLVNAATERAEVQLYIKRDDLIHPTVSGNKWRKLKYNLLDAQASGKGTVLTFGGAYSNHLYATAAAGNALGLKTIGIVRGLELEGKENDTLQFCREQGMQLHFVSREEYRRRHSEEYLEEITARLGNPYLIPEGGTTGHALKGVAEMVVEIKEQLGAMPDFVATAAGTGGTAAGILSAGANVLAFPALKGGDFLKEDIRRLLNECKQPGNLTLLTDYHFGGYAKWNSELLAFMQDFRAEFDVQLEQVYTAKMFYGLFDLLKKRYFKAGTKIVAVHTGGLQGLIKA